MKSSRLGKNTSKVEVTHISRLGIWILMKDQEHFLSFKMFPWFKKASIDEILNVELIRKNHLHWPDIDVDLHLDSLSNPKGYPLVYKS